MAIDPTALNQVAGGSPMQTTQTGATTAGIPGAGGGFANAGGGWDQFATQSGTPQNALQQAFAQGLTGQAAVDAANQSLGLQPPNSISFNGGDGSYGLPNGFYVAPNAQKGGQLDQISRGGGGGGGGAVGDGSASDALWADPGFQARLKYGLSSIQNSAMARGTGLSSGLLKDFNDYAGTQASSEFNNAFSRNMQLADLGYGATGQAANYSTGGASAGAAGTVGATNSVTGALNNIGQNTATSYQLGQFFGNKGGS